MHPKCSFLISSDESETDEHNPILVVKELSWRSDKVTSFFSKLDEAHKHHKSEQARRQTKSRVFDGRMSTRPVTKNVPSWAISSTDTGTA